MKPQQPSSIEIIPSVLVPDEETFTQWAAAVSDSLSMIQIDIADGKFVPDTTWADPDIVEEVLEIDCELHLMVEDPIEEIRLWEEVPQVKRVYVHYETIADEPETLLAQVGSYGWQVGLVLNPDTPLDVVEPLLEELDALMLMGVVPGKQGQKFIPETIKKLSQARERFPHLYLALDGGVNEETLEDIVPTGINAVCPGSAIFGNEETPKENVAQMRARILRLTKD